MLTYFTWYRSISLLKSKRRKHFLCFFSSCILVCAADAKTVLAAWLRLAAWWVSNTSAKEKHFTCFLKFYTTNFIQQSDYFELFFIFEDGSLCGVLFPIKPPKLIRQTTGWKQIIFHLWMSGSGKRARRRSCGKLPFFSRVQKHFGRECITDGAKREQTSYRRQSRAVGCSRPRLASSFSAALVRPPVKYGVVFNGIFHYFHHELAKHIVPLFTSHFSLWETIQDGRKRYFFFFVKFRRKTWPSAATQKTAGATEPATTL